MWTGAHPESDVRAGRADSGAPFDSIFRAHPGPETASHKPVPRTKSSAVLPATAALPVGYRNFGNYESLVTNQSVEARPVRPASGGMSFAGRKAARRACSSRAPSPRRRRHRWMAASPRTRTATWRWATASATHDLVPASATPGRLAGDPAASWPAASKPGQRHRRATHQRPLGRLHLHAYRPVDDCTSGTPTSTTQPHPTTAGQPESARSSFPSCKF